jgi:hypothetical protein
MGRLDRTLAQALISALRTVAMCVLYLENARCGRSRSRRESDHGIDQGTGNSCVRGVRVGFVSIQLSKGSSQHSAEQPWTAELPTAAHLAHQARKFSADPRIFNENKQKARKQ